MRLGGSLYFGMRTNWRKVPSAPRTPHMIDSSSGTCSGTFENVSSAFGGASSLTVAQMLAYAAGTSNAGGSTSYGNVKATRQLAKDAFDAINNQVAISP
jgi:hypothetical protein